MVQGAVYPLPYHQSPILATPVTCSKWGHRSTDSPRTISGLPGHALTAKGDTYSRFHWLVLKLLLRLITHPHDHNLIVKDLFRLHNRPVTRGRLVFIAALSAQRTSLSLKASRLLKAQLQLWIKLHKVERAGDMMVS